MSDMSGDYDVGRETDWLWAPVICAAVLTSGVVAGVVSALRQGGRVEYGGIPLPKCQWLTSRCSVRIAAGGSLLAGLVGQLSALRRFLLGWHDDVPFYLMCLTMGTYSLLAAAIVLAFIGLSWKQTAPKVHEAFRQSAKAALLGGLAAGLAAEVLCNAGEAEAVPQNWRQGCAMLGASSGLLLLGLLAAQVDGQAGLEVDHSEDDAVDEIGVGSAVGADEEAASSTSGLRRNGGSLGSIAVVDGPSVDSRNWPGCHPWPTWSAQEQDLDWAHPRIPPQAQLLPPMPRLHQSSFREPLLLQQSTGASSWTTRVEQPWVRAAAREVPGFAASRGSGAWSLDGCGLGSLGHDLLAAPTLMVR